MISEPMTCVRADCFPNLHACFGTISHDSGGMLHEAYIVSARWALMLPDLELAVRGLTAHDRETFCIGEEKEMRAVARRTNLLMCAHDMLSDWFAGHVRLGRFAQLPALPANANHEPVDDFAAHLTEPLGTIGDRTIGAGHVVMSEERYAWLRRRAGLK